MPRFSNYLLLFLIFIMGSFCRAFADTNDRPSYDLESSKVKIILTPKQKSILSSAISARVIKICLNLGASIKEEEPLIFLDDADIQSLLIKAASAFTNAEIKLQVIQKLFNQGEESLINLNDAEHALRTTAAEYTITQKRLDEMIIRSPFEGRISNVIIREFEYAKAGEPLIEVINDDILIGKMLMPLAFLSKIDFGNSLTIYVPHIDKTISGKVIGIGPLIEPTSATVKVEVEIDNREHRLLPGLFGITTFTHPH